VSGGRWEKFLNHHEVWAVEASCVSVDGSFERTQVDR
jgi:hypothetical protein